MYSNLLPFFPCFWILTEPNFQVTLSRYSLLSSRLDSVSDVGSATARRQAPGG